MGSLYQENLFSFDWTCSQNKKIGNDRELIQSAVTIILPTFKNYYVQNIDSAEETKITDKTHESEMMTRQRIHIVHRVSTNTTGILEQKKTTSVILTCQAIDKTSADPIQLK